MRILVVEDFAGWRRFVLEKLKEYHGLQVIGTASDGLDAVLKADKLQLDLILSDIGLPKSDELQAARHIPKIAPETKLLFLSQEFDPSIALAALSAGGHGYVLKSEAGNELIAAVKAVMVGKKFISPRLAERPA